MLTVFFLYTFFLCNITVILARITLYPIFFTYHWNVNIFLASSMNVTVVIFYWLRSISSRACHLRTYTVPCTVLSLRNSLDFHDIHRSYSHFTDEEIEAKWNATHLVSRKARNQTQEFQLLYSTLNAQWLTSSFLWVGCTGIFSSLLQMCKLRHREESDLWEVRQQRRGRAEARPRPLSHSIILSYFWRSFVLPGRSCLGSSSS